MRETIYNIFYFVENGIISEAAITTHDADGSDEEKVELLKSLVLSDLAKATRIPLSKVISYSTYNAMMRLGTHLEAFDVLFASVGEPSAPVCGITAIVDGSPRIDIVTDHTPLTAQEMQSLNTPALHDIQDWLTMYITEDGFDLPKLLNDDYFNAIKLLFNSQQYVSCMKLLLSFIDTASYLAYGDEKSIFIKWLDTHANLSCLGIRPEELWEMRNALLHMSNLDSRKVLKNSVRRISFCVASRGCCAPPDVEITYFNILDLIDQIANGIAHWIAHINANQEELVQFVARYDRILSDDRRTHIAMPQQSPASDSGWENGK